MYFFLQAIREVDSRYSGLFGKEEGIDEGDEVETNGFIESFGWVYSAKQVAKHNGIKLNEAWDLSYVEFLNNTYLVVHCVEMNSRKKNKYFSTIQSELLFSSLKELGIIDDGMCGKM